MGDVRSHEPSGVHRTHLKVVENQAPGPDTSGLLSSEKGILIALFKLYEERPVESRRFALTEAGELRVRRRVNQFEQYDSIKDHEGVQGATSNLSADGCRNILGILCRRAFVVERVSRPFIDGRMVKHSIYELTQEGIAVAKALLV